MVRKANKDRLDLGKVHRSLNLGRTDFRKRLEATATSRLAADDLVRKRREEARFAKRPEAL